MTAVIARFKGYTVKCVECNQEGLTNSMASAQRIKKDHDKSFHAPKPTEVKDAAG